MKSKRLLAAVVAAIAMLVGGLGMALWPSSAGAIGSIRKFSGALHTGTPFPLYFDVMVHNPHNTATLRPSVVVRDEAGNVTYNQEHPVGPHRVVTARPLCLFVCTVEVNMTSAILQPSIRYLSYDVSSSSATQYFVYPGDFSR